MTIQLRQIDEEIKKLEDENAKLQKQAEALAGANAMAAELIVAVEEAQDALEESNQKLRAITDNVEFGFLMIDEKMRIGDEVTRSCLSLFDTDKVAGEPLDKVLRLEENQAALLQMVVTDIFADLLPSELTCSQMPARQAIGDRLISITPEVIRDEAGKVASLLLSLGDVTDLEQERRESERNMALLRIMNDKTAFKNYLNELRIDLFQAHNAIKTENQVSARRRIHTVKGNSARYGLVETVEEVHRAEEQDTLSRQDIHGIEHTVKTFLEQNHPILGIGWDEKATRHHSVSRGELELLKTHVSTSDLQAVPGWIDVVKEPRVRTLLGPVEGQLQKIGDQRCKKVSVSLDGGNLRVPMGSVGKVLNVVPHMLNNAIVHGIEAPDERGDKGYLGHVRIVVQRTHDDGYVVEVEDDGRGINTQALQVALLLQADITEDELERMPAEERLKLVFVDGLSTLEAGDTLAGRGVGMSAVQECVESVGGAVEVFSNPGAGTRFRIVVPRQQSSAGLAG